MSAILLIIGLSAVFWFFVKLSVNLVDSNKKNHNKPSIKTGSRHFTNKRRHNVFSDRSTVFDPQYMFMDGNIYNDDSRR